MLDERTNYTKNIVQQIKEGYGNDAYIFRSQIPMSVRVAECSGLGVSIYKHDGKCKAAGAYGALVQEVMENAQNGGVS
jgi:chromosome partitioning protein